MLAVFYFEGCLQDPPLRIIKQDLQRLLEDFKEDLATDDGMFTAELTPASDQLSISAHLQTSPQKSEIRGTIDETQNLKSAPPGCRGAHVTVHKCFYTIITNV